MICKIFGHDWWLINHRFIDRVLYWEKKVCSRCKKEILMLDRDWD